MGHFQTMTFLRIKKIGYYNFCFTPLLKHFAKNNFLWDHPMEDENGFEVETGKFECRTFNK